MKKGAFDYLVKSQEVSLDLPRILARALNDWQLKHERISLLHEAKAIFDLSVDMICVAGLDGYFRRLNPAFQHTLRYTTEELCSKPFIDFFHPDDRAATRTKIGSLAKGDHTTSFSNRCLSKSGEYRWLEWNASLAPGGD